MQKVKIQKMGNSSKNGLICPLNIYYQNAGGWWFKKQDDYYLSCNYEVNYGFNAFVETWLENQLF